MSRTNVISMVRPGTRFAFEGEYVEQPDAVTAEALIASALIASSIPVEPPRAWFANPGLRGPTAINVEDDGRVFGHIAAWNVPHIGLPFNTKPPRSKTNYQYFNKGALRTAEGKDVTVGQLTLAGGHAGLEMSAADTIRHYDDTRSAMADVHAGEDMFGIWVAGALRPGVTPEQIRALRASTPSGDWRPIRGRLELVAVLAVNVPGFPVARAMVASSGYITALVAAGAAAIAQLRGPSIDERLERIERALTQNAPDRTDVRVFVGDQEVDLAAKVAELSARVHARRAPDPDPELSAARAALSARVHGVDLKALAAAARARVQEVVEDDTEAALFADYSQDKREEYARKGWALPSGAYPIANVADLRRAIKAYGRATKEDKPKVRRLIMRRARGLHKADLIPPTWLSVSIEERHADLAATIREMRYAPVPDAPVETVSDPDALSVQEAALHYTPRPDHKFEDRLHPRDDEGKFRDVLLRLKKDIEGQPGADEAIQEIDAAQRSNDADEDRETKSHIDNIVKIVDRVAADTSDPNTAKTLRDGYSELGRFVAGTDLPEGVEADKMRYTDLPPETQGLIDTLLDKLEGYVDKETYDKATAGLMDFKRGGDVWNAGELMASLTRIMRFLLGTGNSPEQIKQDAEKKKSEEGV